AIAIATGKHNIESRISEIDQMLRSRASRQTRIARITEELTSFDPAWDHLNMDERREVLALLIEQLTVDRESRDGKDIHGRIKGAFFKERTVPIMIRTATKMKRKPTGLDSLPPRQLVTLPHLDHGCFLSEAAAKRGVKRRTAEFFPRAVKRQLAIRNMDDIL